MGHCGAPSCLSCCRIILARLSRIGGFCSRPS
jgi:hypothetical protein